MTAPRCTRCGDTFEPGRPDDRRCPRCEQEVRALIAMDERRRAARFAVAKSYDRFAR